MSPGFGLRPTVFVGFGKQFGLKKKLPWAHATLSFPRCLPYKMVITKGVTSTRPNPDQILQFPSIQLFFLFSPFNLIKLQFKGPISQKAF